MANERHLWDIVLPQAMRVYRPDPLRVTIKSPRDQRRAVWKISKFLQRECEYAPLYGSEGNETDPTCIAYLWQCGLELGYGPGRSSPCVGAACFRKVPGYGQLMAWVWLHPYCRRSGLLSEAWEMFEANHPGFAVAHPRSPAMVAFLEKRGHAGGIKGWHVDLDREKEAR